MTRAADDFPAIRARMEELRRERAEASVTDEGEAFISSGPAVSSSPLANKQVLAAYVRRLIEQQRQKASRQPRLVGRG